MEPNQPMQPVQPVPPMPAGAAPVPPTPVRPVAPVPPAAPKMEEAPVEVKPVMESKPVSETSKKKSNVPIIMMVLFLVIAAAGVGFGVWMMFEKDSMAENYTKQIAALKAQAATGGNTNVDNNGSAEVVPATSSISNSVAQNLISPYIKTYNYLNNIFDYEFNEDSKAVTVLRNLTPPVSEVSGEYKFNVGYYQMNMVYQDLFGDDEEFGRKNYSIDHGDSLEYTDNVFVWTPYMGGGAGIGTFDVVKSATYDGDNILVDVYHDNISMCTTEGSNDYCLEGVSSAKFDSIDDGNMKELIENYEERIPVYEMTFTQNGGHYVLSSLKKI